MLRLFPPRFTHVVADRVTLHSTSAGHVEMVPPPVHAMIVGHALDDRGVEALIVAIAGTTERPAGGHYHITWSLAEDRTAQESNDIIAHFG